MSRADFNANVNSAWCILAFFAACVLGWKAWHFVWHEGRSFTALRVQLAVALGIVLLGDAINRGVAWLYWELRAMENGAVIPWPQEWVLLGQIGGVFAVIGAIVAIRALTFDHWGNLLWLTALACAALGVIAF